MKNRYRITQDFRDDPIVGQTRYRVEIQRRFFFLAWWVPVNYEGYACDFWGYTSGNTVLYDYFDFEPKVFLSYEEAMDFILVCRRIRGQSDPCSDYREIYRE